MTDQVRSDLQDASLCFLLKTATYTRVVCCVLLQSDADAFLELGAAVLPVSLAVAWLSSQMGDIEESVTHL